MDNWYHPLALGEPLSTLSIWRNESLPISLDRKASYKATCRSLWIR